jgi:hypothetical protein
MTDLRKAAEPVSYTGNGTAGREADVRPTGFFFQMTKREWVGLTDEEMRALKQKSVDDGMTRIVTDFEYIRSIEAKLKEKNA